MKEKTTMYLTIILLSLWFLLTIVAESSFDIPGIEFILPVIALVAAVLLCVQALWKIRQTQPDKERERSEKGTTSIRPKSIVKYLCLIAALCWMALETMDALLPALKGIGETTHTVLGILVILAVINAFWPQTKKQG